jgi:glycosyltransferase involved in cell wall biosynthesis
MGFLYDFAGLIEIIKYYNPKVKNEGLKLKFIILGDGGIYSSLKRFVKQQSANWVYLMGRIPYEEITEYIKLADLCLQSFSINEITKEITPIKIIEYMAMNKPVLSTALPGVISQFGKSSGIIFAKNQKDMIEQIEFLIPKRNKLKERATYGCDYVKKNFTWKKIVEDFKTIMIELIREFYN